MNLNRNLLKKIKKRINRLKSKKISGSGSSDLPFLDIGVYIFLFLFIFGTIFVAFELFLPQDNGLEIETRYEQVQNDKPEIDTDIVLEKNGEFDKFEIYPDEKNGIETVPHKNFLKEKLPKVAIIIDDIGYDSAIANRLLDLNIAITFSILPFSPGQNKIAKKAYDQGVEIMLHIPMEPFEYPRINPGPGALLSTMSGEEFVNQLNKDLEVVPYIVGVNNHMGSKITSIGPLMGIVFTELNKRDLFFIDSRTTNKTKCRENARISKIPFGKRDVFLDHFQTREAVLRQIKKLIKIAQKKGFAIGIGHPYSVTCDAINESIPELEAKVDLVFASDIIDLNN